MASPLSIPQASSDQLGAMVIQDGVIVKSEGELANSERLANVVQRMVAVGPFFPPNRDFQMSSTFDRLSVLYPSYQYDIVVGSGGAGVPVSGGRKQHQRQVIYVVKRTLGSRLAD